MKYITSEIPHQVLQICNRLVRVQNCASMPMILDSGY